MVYLAPDTRAATKVGAQTERGRTSFLLPALFPLCPGQTKQKKIIVCGPTGEDRESTTALGICSKPGNHPEETITSIGAHFLIQSIDIKLILLGGNIAWLPASSTSDHGPHFIVPQATWVAVGSNILPIKKKTHEWQIRCPTLEPPHLPFTQEH